MECKKYEDEQVDMPITPRQEQQRIPPPKHYDASLINKKEASDVVFLVGHEREPVHALKSILAQRSPYFHHMFNGPFKESGEHGGEGVPLPESQPSIFMQVLTFIYTGDIDRCCLTPESLIAVLFEAEHYELPDMQALCISFAKSQLNITNALSWLDESVSLGSLLPTLNLELLCLRWIAAHAEETFASEQWKELSKECVLKIVRSDAVIASEKAVLAAIMAWHDAANVREEDLMDEPHMEEEEMQMEKKDHTNKAVVVANEGGHDHHHHHRNFTDLLSCVRLAELSWEELHYDIEPLGLFSSSQLLQAYKFKGNPLLMKTRFSSERNFKSRPRAKEGNKITISFPGLRWDDLPPEQSILSEEFDLSQGVKWQLELRIPKKTEAGTYFGLYLRVAEIVGCEGGAWRTNTRWKIERQGIEIEFDGTSKVTRAFAKSADLSAATPTCGFNYFARIPAVQNGMASLNISFPETCFVRWDDIPALPTTPEEQIGT